MKNYWNVFARNYRLLGAPLKPAPEDIAVVEATLAHWRTAPPGREFNALLCGVTPALADLRFPAPTRLLGVEQSEPMIRGIWPGNNATRTAVRGNWLALPVADHRCDVVMGDGCFNCMDYPRGYQALFASLHRVLVRGGIVLMRVFARPTRREAVETVFADLQAATIPNFHIFKWRLAMALQRDTETGLMMNEIHEAWTASGVRSADLAARLGWQEEVIDIIDTYKGKATRLSFPTIEEVRAVLPEGFEEMFVRVPGYDMGERCPMFALKAR